MPMVNTFLFLAGNLLTKPCQKPSQAPIRSAIDLLTHSVHLLLLLNFNLTINPSGNSILVLPYLYSFSDPRLYTIRPRSIPPKTKLFQRFYIHTMTPAEHSAAQPPMSKIVSKAVFMSAFMLKELNIRHAIED